MLPFVFVAVLLHPVHQTVAEVEWNEETKRVEVAVRLHALDEEWISRWYRGGQDKKQWRKDYVASRFRFAGERSQLENSRLKKDPQDAYHWVGREVKGSHVWWYFEVEAASGKQPRWIAQRMLFQRDDRYTHRILILEGQSQRALDLSTEKPIARLEGGSPTEEETP